MVLGGVLILAFLGLTQAGFPHLIATKGRPWPLPQREWPGKNSLKLHPCDFTFTATGHSCEILTSAFQRYTRLIFPCLQSSEGSDATRSNPSWKDQVLHETFLKHLQVNILTPCEFIPHLYMNEQYELQICSSESEREATLISQSVWGALRGLETFSQIAVYDPSAKTFTINCTQILDFPRFTHRGILLDTSRHYLPVSTIKQNLELMAMNKFNVFHWHIVDDQSFPYQSDVYPNLSAKGAWSKHHVYTGKDITYIVDYARKLGIRVIVEFDTPGHMRSWGPGQPGLLTKCSQSDTADPLYGPWTIDPSKEQTYEFLQRFFGEASIRFPDFFLHLGGDEVNLRCWMENENITRFMNFLNITNDYKKLKGYYTARLLALLSNLSFSKGSIVWEEAFDNNVPMPVETIVQVWKYPGLRTLYNSKMSKVTSAGHRVILSACWYLNYINYGEDWHKYYECDPEDFVGTPRQKRLVLGGEACMWGEFVDETNLIPRLWPRAASVAERLWSPRKRTTDLKAASSRLEEHRCRLYQRGYNVQSLGPSFCSVAH